MCIGIRIDEVLNIQKMNTICCRISFRRIYSWPIYVDGTANQHRWIMLLPICNGVAAMHTKNSLSILFLFHSIYILFDKEVMLSITMNKNIRVSRGGLRGFFRLSNTQWKIWQQFLHISLNMHFANETIMWWCWRLVPKSESNSHVSSEVSFVCKWNHI